ncbi:hypothetical protein DV736_g1196, partial [Chaetothyriales sp. CBS 134916]
MPRAIARVGNVVIAETDKWEVVEGNFPPSSTNQDLLKPSDHFTYCSWKGHATYRTVVADGKTLENVAWFYPKCFDKAKHIENSYAFYKNQGVEIITEDE